MKDEKVTHWICESNDCKLWHNLGHFCKIETTAFIMPSFCPFVGSYEAKWKETEKGEEK